MALYPGARQRPIAPGTNDPPIIVIGAILHVDAGDSKSLYGYFNGPSNGIESHFHVPKAHPVEQYRDTGREADANLKANSFTAGGKRCGYVSIETQGLGSGSWNAYQLAEIKKLLLWLSLTHRFPLVRCPAHGSPGVGYHIMFGAPGPWTPVAKSCPGADRIRQFNNELVPWMADVTGRNEDMDLDDEMPGTRSDENPGGLTVRQAILSGVWAATVTKAGGDAAKRDEAQQAALTDIIRRVTALEKK